jgi:hypothetical protein
MAIRSRSGAAMPGGLQCFTADRGPVGSVFGQGLAGPVAGDQDTTAADAEVFSIMSLAGTAAGPGPDGLLGVEQLIHSRPTDTEHVCGLPHGPQQLLHSIVSALY